MSKPFKTFALSAALASGLIAASPLLAEDTHHFSGSDTGSGMMGEGGMMGMMGMMNMMQQMNRMMEVCTKMMESAVNKDEDLDRPSPTTPDEKG